MPTPKRGPRLASGPAHQKHLLANQARDLFRHGRIRTTEAKAKALRPYAEKLITKAKRGDIASRREVLSKLHDREVVAYLFEDVAPRFADRNGGYTRILKLEPRKGDNARLAIIELVERGGADGDEVIEEAKASRSRGLFGRRRKREGAESAPAAAATATLGADQAAAGEDEPEEPAFDVEDDEQVAAAIAEATGADGVEADDDAAADDGGDDEDEDEGRDG